jgi:hypothetical protein
MAVALQQKNAAVARSVPTSGPAYCAQRKNSAATAAGLASCGKATELCLRRAPSLVLSECRLSAWGWRWPRRPRAPGQQHLVSEGSG